MADGVIFDFTGFAGRTANRHKRIRNPHLLQQYFIIKEWIQAVLKQHNLPGGVRSWPVVLSISSFSTTKVGNSSSIGNLPFNSSHFQHVDLDLLTLYHHFTFTYLLHICFMKVKKTPTYQAVEGPVQISRGPKIFPSVFVSRPLLACAWVTLARCVRRYCRVRRWWRGTVVEFSSTRLTSLLWLPATAPSERGINVVNNCLGFSCASLLQLAEKGEYKECIWLYLVVKTHVISSCRWKQDKHIYQKWNQRVLCVEENQLKHI